MTFMFLINELYEYHIVMGHVFTMYLYVFGASFLFAALFLFITYWGFSSRLIGTQS